MPQPSRLLPTVMLMIASVRASPAAITSTGTQTTNRAYSARYTTPPRRWELPNDAVPESTEVYCRLPRARDFAGDSGADGVGLLASSVRAQED